ncbi:hypothetical protein L7F22_016760 [Adiantum nelumboides]|nr:hypothetical protein [Adiantum nelumboides]
MDFHALISLYACSTVEDVQYKLSKKFEMKDFGELHYILGIEVSWLKKGDIFISQQKYLHSILDRFGMISSKPVSTPMESTLKLTNEHGVPYDATLYRQLIGSLIYLTITQPDTCFAVNTLAQFMQAPKVSHWIAAKRVLRYLKGTPSLGILYGGDMINIHGYSDSDYTANLVDRKSISGNAFFLDTGAISWSSKKQNTISLSSTEAEYKSLTTSACESIWLQRCLQELGFYASGQPTPILCDNTSAEALANNPVMHQRTKHIEV